MTISDVTLVLLGGSVDLSRWTGALEAIRESAVAYERIVASATASPFAALVGSGYSPEEIGKYWNEFSASVKEESISADQIGAWVGSLLERKGVREFGDLKGSEAPEFKLVVRDVEEAAVLTLPDDAWKLGLQPDELGIVSAVRASMSVPDVRTFAPVRLGRRRLAGYYGPGAQERPDWNWGIAVRPETMALCVYSEPVVLGKVRNLVSRVFSPSYYRVLATDKAIYQSQINFPAWYGRLDEAAGTEIAIEDTNLRGVSMRGRLINLRNLPSWKLLETDNMAKAAKAETQSQLDVIGFGAGRGGQEQLWVRAEPREQATTERVGPPPRAPEPPLIRGPGFPPSGPGGPPTGAAGGDKGGDTPPGPPFTVFPKIDVSDEHPVQTFPVTITVSLEFKEDPKTAGGPVNVPVDNEPHVFDVHLLFGRESHWGQLTFQRPMGTTAAAEFLDVPAPQLEANKQGVVDNHLLHEIYVNFYLENRWCGEAARQIEVRAGKDSPSLASIPKLETPEWRDGLLVAPGTPPPDLLIRIENIGSQEFEWSVFSPYMKFSKKDVGNMRKSLSDPPYTYVKDNFEKFSGAVLSDEQIETLYSSCGLIYDAAPQGFHKAYRELCAEVAKDTSGRTRFETIQIVSSEPFVPWELMRVSDPSEVPAFEPEILCVKHCVGRWVARDSNQLRSSLHVQEIAVSASDYKAKNVVPKVAPLEWAAEEKKFLESKPYKARTIPLQLPALQKFLREGSAEIIHFSCHGETDVQLPAKATLKTEDHLVGLQASWVSMPEVRTGAGKCHPLVFLNACQAAAAGQVIGMVFGWPEAFLQMGATACIAPLWKVIDSRAKEIAEVFYEDTLCGTPDCPPAALGETLRKIRAQWKEKRSLTHLGYVLYGDPTTRLTWMPTAATPAPVLPV
jgi:hypothetical protein